MNDDDPFLASLLYEDEGSTLDFKREQYPYVTNEQKGELIKDILAFTNAWRHADAYILIGVAEKPGSYATVIGVTDHLKDAEIQQLVNSKTNQPVTFSYRSARLDGKNIGVLHIPIQDRPRFITKRFGKLAADTVYLRRGSSTAVAQPDEIARMGATHTPQTSPVLQLQFADAKQRRLTGDTQAIHATHFAIDDIEEIPKYEERTPFGPGSLTYWPYRTNPNYLQDRTVYIWAQHLCKPLQFAITNSGPVTAMDVRVELTVQSPHAVLFDEDSWPKEPASREDRFSIAHNLSGFHMKYDDSITVQQLPDYSSVVKFCTHKIQPKETKWIESLLYLGARSSGKIILNGTMRADNISTPQPARLTVICTTEQNNMEGGRQGSTPRGAHRRMSGHLITLRRVQRYSPPKPILVRVSRDFCYSVGICPDSVTAASKGHELDYVPLSKTKAPVVSDPPGKLFYSPIKGVVGGNSLCGGGPHAAGSLWLKRA